MDNREFQQAYRKARSEFKNNSKISECFYHDKTACKGVIKQSHSIQCNNRLSIIEGKVNGQNSVYTLTEIEYTAEGSIRTLKPIGKKSASTFFGFCEYHDTSLFSPIENFPFDDSDLHCFLHSYRSFAHSYHIKKESLKAYTSEAVRRTMANDTKLKQSIFGTELAVRELEIEKKKLDEIIQTKSYDGLEYLTCILSKKCPIASSSIIQPEYSYKNKPINIDYRQHYSTLMLTVLPDHNKTIIILACFLKDQKAITLLNELNDIKYPLLFEKAISSLIINNAENTFLAPALWNALEESGQKQLCKEIEFVQRGMPKKFIHSKINFFDTRFSATRLGI